MFSGIVIASDVPHPHIKMCVCQTEAQAAFGRVENPSRTDRVNSCCRNMTGFVAEKKTYFLFSLIFKNTK